MTQTTKTRMVKSIEINGVTLENNREKCFRTLEDKHIQFVSTEELKDRLILANANRKRNLATTKK